MVDVFKIAGISTDTVASKTFKIASIATTLGANAGSSFICNGASYQVAAGKTFNIVGLLNTAQCSQAGQYICYADDAAMTTNRSGAIVYISTQVGNRPYFIDVNALATVPATKYVGVWSVGNSTTYMSILGYEV